MISNPQNAPRLDKGRLLKGANVHHRSTVYAQPLAPGSWEVEVDATRSTEFRHGFAQLFGEAPHTDGSLTELFLQATLAIERKATHALGRLDEPGMARIVRSEDVVHFVWEAHTGWVSRDAARVAFAGLTELLGDELRGPSFADQLAELERRARRRRWGSRAAALAFAAHGRGIPHEVLAGNYVRLGEGIQQVVVAADADLDEVYPVGTRPRIPTALIVGEKGTHSLATAVDRKLRAGFGGVGLATHKRTTIQGEPVDPTTLGSRKGPDFLLGDPRVAVMIATSSPRRIAQKGLRLDECSVAAVLDPTPDGDGAAYRSALDVVLAATTGIVVIGADNPFATDVAAGREASRVVLCGQEPEERRNAIVRALNGGANE